MYLFMLFYYRIHNDNTLTPMRITTTKSQHFLNTDNSNSHVKNNLSMSTNLGSRVKE